MKKKDHQTSQELKMLQALIKRQLKLKNMTYQSLAKKLNVSEITIKRWLTGSHLTCENLLTIGKVLRFRPFSAIKADFASPGQFKFYSRTQEKVLIENPLSFLIFIKLAFGYKFEDLKDLMMQTEPQILKHLAILEKARLIELWPENKIKFTLTGPYRIRIGDPLSKAYFPHLIKVIVQHFTETYKNRVDDVKPNACVLFRPTEIYLSDESAHNLSSELNRVFAKYAQLSIFEVKQQRKVKPISVLLGVSPFDAWTEVLRPKK